MFHRRGRLAERIARFMAGRNGPDTLYYVFFALAFIATVLQWFTDKLYPSLVAALFIGYALFRFMSRNVYKRRQENEKFRRFVFNVTHPRRREKRTHVFRKCRYCKSRLRLRRVKGKHTVRCPRCNGLFDVKIR